MRVLFGLVLVGCGSTGPSPPPAAPAGHEGVPGACDSALRVGGFEVGHWDGLASVSGRVLGARLPHWETTELAADGGCALLRRPSLFCDPPCIADQVCTLDGECAPYPRAQDLGTVTVTGLAETLSMTADVTGTYWDTALSAPLFEPGEPIAVATEEADLPALSMDAAGVAVLAEVDALWTLTDGAGLVVTWAEGGAEEVLVEIDVDQHGITPALLACAGPDTGRLEVSVELVDTFLAEGVSGFPGGSLRRRNAAHADLEGECVDLQVYDQRTVPVAVEGHVPCFDDTWCPKGQECDLATQTCVDSE